MEETSKQPPVDRGKLLIGLELCRDGTIHRCHSCPYHEPFICAIRLPHDALAYILYLEEQLGVTGL